MIECSQRQIPALTADQMARVDRIMTEELGISLLQMAVPFLAAAAAFGTAPGVVRWVNRRLAPISAVGGAVVLALGVVLLLGIEQRLFAELAGLAPWTPWEPNL